MILIFYFFQIKLTFQKHHITENNQPSASSKHTRRRDKYRSSLASFHPCSRNARTHVHPVNTYRVELSINPTDTFVGSSRLINNAPRTRRCLNNSRGVYLHAKRASFFHILIFLIAGLDVHTLEYNILIFCIRNFR